MEWRIRKDAHGGFSVERGLNHKGGEKIPGVMGATMPAFIVYESAHFDTDKQVKSFMKRKRAELMQGGETAFVLYFDERLCPRRHFRRSV